MNIIIALLIFSLIVIIHELGHFLLAKRGGITVTEFALGMGPCLYKKQIGETSYALKLLPFGGSCAMVGEDDESVEEGSFGSKSVWTRISVVAAGPIFNFILAFLLALIVVGLNGYDAPIVVDVMEGYPAQEAGIEAGDEILQINGKDIHIYREISTYLQMNPSETLKIFYNRDGEYKIANIEPRWDAERGAYLMGFLGSGVRTQGNILDTIYYSQYEVGYWISTTVQSLKMLVSGGVKAEDVSGPVGIVGAIGDTYEQSKVDGIYYIIMNMLNISILLSANLGVMNLLPLPALDGGRLVFLFLEAIRRKKVDPNKEGMVHFVGLMILLGLMVFIMFNDIKNIFM